MKKQKQILLMKRVHIGSGLNQTTLLERNADIVWSGGYHTVNSTNGQGIAAKSQGIIKNNQGISRINGTIVSIKLHIDYLPAAPQEYNFEIWRKDGSTYDRVYVENLWSKLTAGGEITVTLNANCNVLTGDYVGESSTYNSSAKTWGYITGQSANSYREVLLPTERVTTDMDWDVATGYTLMPTIKLYAQAPLIVCLGDSIMAGHPLNYTGVENYIANVPDNSIDGQLYILDTNYIIQNMSKGGQQTSWVKASMADYVIALKPKMAILGGGLNDVGAGTVTQETFIANWTDILYDCVANSIIPVVCKMIPWTNGTDEQSATIDTWNAALGVLVSTYEGAICVDFHSAIGQFRVGGTEGNLWDIKTEYDYDHVHLNLAGYAKMAEVINIEIKKIYRFT